jgi:Fe-S-cluster-containing hydrogenase component 2
MRVVLAGTCKYSESLRSALTDAGLAPVVVTTPAALSAFPEETPVLLLHDAKLHPLLTDMTALEKAARDLEPQDEVVFLMDREEDASPYAESRVLAAATRLAALKRHVTVLLRSFRASDAGFDDRYLAARQRGVAFIKYETLALTSDEDGVYGIDAHDGTFSVSLDTPLLIDCAEAPDAELDAFAKALRVRTYDGGRVSGARWFLSGGATLKRNVRRIDTDALGGDAREIAPSLARDILALENPSRERIASVDAEKCAFCYTCYRVCPHSALDKDPRASAMKVNELLCEACGVCATVCPASAIAFAEAEALDGKTEAGKVEDGKTEAARGRLKIFCCENSALIASREILIDADATIESVPCGGDVSAVMMTEALKSYDNAMIAVCSDDACRHPGGNRRCVKQIERLRERLARLGHEPDRLRFVQMGVAMANVLKDAVRSVLAEGEGEER